MVRVNKVVSILVLVCFLFNTAVSDISFAQISNHSSNVDNLATALRSDDIMGMEYKDRGRIQFALQEALTRLCKSSKPLTKATFQDTLKKMTLYEKAQSQPAKMQFFWHEPKGQIEDSLCYMVRLKDEYGIDPRTYYVTFSLPENVTEAKIEDFYIKVYTDRQYKDTAGFVKGMPRTKPEDLREINRYVRHEESIDTVIAYAHEHDLAKEPVDYGRFDYKAVVKQILEDSGITVTNPHGLIPIEDRKFYFVKLTKEIQDMIAAKPAIVIDADGKEHRVLYFAHSSNDAVHVFVSEDTFDVLTASDRDMTEPERNTRYKKALDEVGDKLEFEIGAPLGFPVIIESDRFLWNEVSLRRHNMGNISNGKPIRVALVDLDHVKGRDYAAGVSKLENTGVLRDPGKGTNDLIIVAAGETVVANALAASRRLKMDGGYNVKVINVVSVDKISDDNDLFRTYLEGGVPVIIASDAPDAAGYVLRTANVVKKAGKSPEIIYVAGSVMTASTPRRNISEIGGIDEKAIVAYGKELLSNVEARLSPLREFDGIDQDIWLDGLTWDIIESGEFELLVKRHGITGVTTNPSLIKAYLKNPKVLAKIAALAKENKTRDEIYFAVMKELAEAVIAVFVKCGVDGKFSVELNPEKADDVEASVREAKMWTDIDPKHIMVKVALTETDAAYQIIEEVTAMGRMVNATLLFTPDQYLREVEAYIAGLERAAAEGLDISEIYSVASFFVSRWDVKLGEVIPPELHGKFANSVATFSYNEIFMPIFLAAPPSYIMSPEIQYKLVTLSIRFDELEAWNHARPQEFLLASTGSKREKMPAEFQHLYPENIYVEPIMGPYIVNTLPLKPTIFDLIDNPIAIDDLDITITKNRKSAVDTMIKMRDITNIPKAGAELLTEGTAAFIKDFKNVMKTIEDIIAKEKPVVPAEQTEIAAMASLADEAGKQIPFLENERYNLLVTEEFFANGELKADKETYGDRFNLDSISGDSDESLIRNILLKSAGKGARTIALVSDKLPDEKLAELTAEKIRFVRVNTLGLLEAKENSKRDKKEKAYREQFQLDTYAMMLLLRWVDNSITPDSSIYRLLSFYLKSHFELTDKIAVDDYITAIVNNDIPKLIQGYLAYRPIQPYDVSEYGTVAEALLTSA
ncbi:MAG: transaldolase family protein [Candidatus Omnitrophota bacterium]